MGNKIACVYTSDGRLAKVTARRLVEKLFPGWMVWSNSDIGVGAVADSLTVAPDMCDMLVIAYDANVGMDNVARDLYKRYKNQKTVILTVGVYER